MKTYIEAHGARQSHLNEFTTFILDDGLKKAVPHLYNSDSKLTELKSVCIELESRGLIQIHGNNRYYSITKEGFALASKGLVSTTIEYFNSNPGWAVLISLVSLVVSAIALLNMT